MERSGTLFRDPEDVEQATRFLHENGRFISTLFIFFQIHSQNIERMPVYL